jgi:hypothetical protein
MLRPVASRGGAMGRYQTTATIAPRKRKYAFQFPSSNEMNKLWVGHLLDMRLANWVGFESSSAILVDVGLFCESRL